MLSTLRFASSIPDYPPFSSADLQLGKPCSYLSLCGTTYLRTIWEQNCAAPDQKRIFRPPLLGPISSPARQRRCSMKGAKRPSSLQLPTPLPGREQHAADLFLFPYPAPEGHLHRPARLPKDRLKVCAATKPKRTVALPAAWTLGSAYPQQAGAWKSQHLPSEPVKIKLKRAASWVSKASRGSEQVPPALTQGLLPFTQPEAGTPPLKLVPAGPDSPGFGETEGKAGSASPP